MNTIANFWKNPFSIALFVCIVIILNLIVARWFWRVDLTDDNLYSLSDASINILEELEDPVTVKAYFTDGVAALSSTQRFVSDKLAEYKAYGGNNFQYEFVNPDSEELKQQAQELGIPSIQVQVPEEDGIQLKNVFLGLSFAYGNESETIPVVQDLASLEYDITVAIRKIASRSLPKVGFLTGHGESGLYESLATYRQLLERTFDIESISVVGDSLSSKPDVLMVIAPSDSFSVHTNKALDTYITEGGKIGFFINPVEADFQRGAWVNTSGVLQWLANYGIIANSDLIKDKKSALITSQAPNGFPFQMQYAFLPIADTFNEESIIAQGVRQIVFPFVSSLAIAEAPNNIKITPLVYTSSQSEAQIEPFDILPNPETPEESFSGGPYVVAASYEGVFEHIKTEKKTTKTRIVVVADGDFLNEQLSDIPDDNYVFGINAIDWLLQDQTLASIRVKNVQPRNLAEVSNSAKSFIKYLNIFAPALLIIVFGLVRWPMRNAQASEISSEIKE